MIDAAQQQEQWAKRAGGLWVNRHDAEQLLEHGWAIAFDPKGEEISDPMVLMQEPETTQ